MVLKELAPCDFHSGPNLTFTSNVQVEKKE